MPRLPVFITLMSGEQIALEVATTTTVLQVKELLKTKMHVAKTAQKLLHNGTVLPDNKSCLDLIEKTPLLEWCVIQDLVPESLHARFIQLDMSLIISQMVCKYCEVASLNMKHCQTCKERYCCVEHQRADWENHKLGCVRRCG